MATDHDHRFVHRGDDWARQHATTNAYFTPHRARRERWAAPLIATIPVALFLAVCAGATVVEVTAGPIPAHLGQVAGCVTAAWAVLTAVAAAVLVSEGTR